MRFGAGDGFSNPILGSDGTLIREAIVSPDWDGNSSDPLSDIGTAGWGIFKNGIAIFNGGVFRGTVANAITGERYELSTATVATSTWSFIGSAAVDAHGLAGYTGDADEDDPAFIGFLTETGDKGDIYLKAARLNDTGVTAPASLTLRHGDGATDGTVRIHGQDGIQLSGDHTYLATPGFTEGERSLNFNPPGSSSCRIGYASTSGFLMVDSDTLVFRVSDSVCYLPELPTISSVTANLYVDPSDGQVSRIV